MRLDEGADLAAVSALFERCSDYFLLQDGEPATAQDARDLFHDVPSGYRSSDLVVFGSRRDTGLDAVAALLPDHPAPGTWYLPFMLIDPALRGRGLGQALHARLTTWAAARGARTFQLVVLDSNDSGVAFWQRLGYRVIGRVGPHRFKSREHHRIELACELDAARQG